MAAERAQQMNPSSRIPMPTQYSTQMESSKRSRGDWQGQYEAAAPAAQTRRFAPGERATQAQQYALKRYGLSPYVSKNEASRIISEKRAQEELGR